MIDIIPAIDLIDGQCVRLTQGSYEDKTVYSESPLDVAKEIEAAGIKRLHLVDLDGAKAGQVKNLQVLETLAKNTKLSIDFGGGITSLDLAKEVRSAGADYLVIGSLAVKEPEVAESIINELGNNAVILAADLKAGQVAVSGWQDTSGLSFNKFIKPYIELGVNNVLCTEIENDGTLQGVDLNFYSNLINEHPDLYLIASGGVASMDDIKNLDQANIPAVVVGKALYEERISLRDIADYVS